LHVSDERLGGPQTHTESGKKAQNSTKSPSVGKPEFLIGGSMLRGNSGLKQSQLIENTALATTEPALDVAGAPM